MNVAFMFKYSAIIMFEGICTYLEDEEDIKPKYGKPMETD